MLTTCVKQYQALLQEREDAERGNNRTMAELVGAVVINQTGYLLKQGDL